jgi:integrase
MRRATKGEGRVYQDNGKWYVRRYTGEKIEKVGKTEYKRKAFYICDHDSNLYRTESQVKQHPTYLEIVRPASNPVIEPGILRFDEYVENTYLPFTETTKKNNGDDLYTPSTRKGYRNDYNLMIKPFAQVPFTDFADPGTTQRILDTLARDKYSKRTLQHVKRFISGVINHALLYNRAKIGFLVNPLMDGGKVVRIDPVDTSEEDEYAYTLAETEDVLALIESNQLYRALVAVAAYGGLRRSEIRGLQWGDIEIDPTTKWGTIRVERTYGDSGVGRTKTTGSKAEIPLIPQLAQELLAYRADREKLHTDLVALDRFIFEGPRFNKPWDVSDLGKQIKVLMDEEELKDEDGGSLWHGWKAWRSGLSNTLDDLGFDSRISSSILRHKHPEGKSATVTQKHYIKMVKMPKMRDAMEKFSAEIERIRHEQQRRKSA